MVKLAIMPLCHGGVQGFEAPTHRKKNLSNMIWIFIAFLICIVVGCIVTYKTTKLHELHKIRAEFEDKMHVIDSIRRLHEQNHDSDVEYLKGEEEGLKEAEKILDKENKTF